MTALKDAVELTRIAADMRDQLVVQGSGSEWMAEIEVLSSRYRQRLAALQAVIDTNGFDELLGEPLANLHRLSAEGAQPASADLGDFFNTNQQLVSASWMLVQEISYQSGLYQDRNADNFVLMKLVLDEMEPLLEHQGRLRSFATSSVKAGAINSSVLEHLNRLLDQLIDDQQQIASGFRPLVDGDGRFSEVLVNSASRVINSQGIGLEQFENQLLLDENLDHPWQRYFADQSAAFEAIYGFIDQALITVEQHLLQRQQSQQQQFYLLAIGIGVVFLLSNYLMLGFNVSVRTNISTMLKAADRLAQGDMTRQIHVSNRDELGQLAHKFNQTTERMRGLLAEVTTTVESVVSQAERGGRHSSAEQSLGGCPA